MTDRIFVNTTRKLLLFAFLLCSSCALQQPKADLHELYDDAAQQSELNRNPVIVIPGILGSKLYDQSIDHETWGVFNNQYTSPSSPEKARSVALPMAIGKNLSSLKDSIISIGALDRVKFKLFGVPLQPRAYAPILSTLGAGGYRDQELALNGAVKYPTDHFTCFQFHYDWRRSNVENAAALDQFIKEKRKFIRGKLKERFGVDKKDIKFDIVAHSMGGLITRYYMRYGKQPLPQNGSLPKLTWAGAKNVENVILVGTPNHGSVIAFEELINGKTFAPKILQKLKATNLPSYPPEILGTYPSIYELLPRTRHYPFVDTAGDIVDIYDIELWKKFQWGLLKKDKQNTLQWLLPNTKTESNRNLIAEDHLKKSLLNAKQFHKALDRKVTNLPAHVKFTLIAGDPIKTKERIKFDMTTGTFSDNHYSMGDGVVLRSSVIADERLSGNKKTKVISPIPYDDIIFLPHDHLNITKDPVFSNNVLYKLLEQ